MAPGRDAWSPSNLALCMATGFGLQMNYLHIQIFPYASNSSGTMSVHLPFFAIYYYLTNKHTYIPLYICVQAHK